MYMYMYMYCIHVVFFYALRLLSLCVCESRTLGCVRRESVYKIYNPLSQFSRPGTHVSYSFCVHMFVLFGCGVLGLGFLSCLLFLHD